MSITAGNDILAADFVDTSAGASDAGKVLKIRANGRLSHTGTGFFGDGADGAVHLDGTNTFAFMSKVGSVYTMTRDIFCTDLTIDSGVTLKHANYRIFVNGTASGTGKIQGNGANGTAGGNANSGSAGGGGAGTSDVVGFFTSYGGGSGGAGQASNGAGPGAGVSGTAVTNSIGAGSHATVISPTLAIQTQSSSLFPLASGYTFNGKLYGHGGVDSGGGGAGIYGGSWYGNGGGGGGAGQNAGILFMCVRVYAASYTIELIGGNGGNGGNGYNNGVSGGNGGTAGNGGGGGISVLFYETKTGTNTYTLTVGTGGTAGTGASPGGTNGGTGANGPAGASYEIAI